MLNPHLDLSVSITCASEFARTGGFEINIWQVFFSTDVYYHTFDNCDSTSLPAHPYLTSIEQCRLAPPPRPGLFAISLDSGNSNVIETQMPTDIVQ